MGKFSALKLKSQILLSVAIVTHLVAGVYIRLYIYIRLQLFVYIRI